jgi:O-antigen ligase/tetratricopeptide (TPR) repeat protein
MKDILQGVVFVGLFLIPFLPVYVENDFFFPYITGKNFAFRIIIEIVFASWILLALYDEKYRPKFSWILAAFAGFVGVMAIANSFGEYPLQSFWSNFERMDGWITLIHLFMFIAVAGSVLTTKRLWSYFFHTSVVIAFLIALHGLAQYFGVIEGPAASRSRIDSRLGNAAYMAIYMLFHIFIVFWLFVRTKVTLHRILYLSIAAIFAVTLLFTGTRGTFVGFVGGTAVAVAYVAIFGRAYPELRRAAIIACVAIAMLAGGFWVVKDSAVVQSNPALARIANIDLGKDLVVRGTIWKMAWEGVKERPVLGWGQSNFNYVFNEHFDPSLYAAESWFDRTHNIIFDWLIAGGIVGLLTYFSIFFAALYYLFWVPIFRKNDNPDFDVLERGVFLGLLAGYLIHNLVVFDNIISYIFYGCILALVHAHVSTPIKAIAAWKPNPQMVTQMALPLMILITGAGVYFINAPGIGAAADIIDAMSKDTAIARLEAFHSALERNSFGDQEIVEQLAQQAMAIVRNTNIPEEERQAMVARAERELLKLADEKPGDARIHAFLSSFYRAIGALPQAQEQAAIARTLSPNKQSLIIEQGIVELQLGDNEKALGFLKEAFELDESNVQARVLYASLLIGTDRKDDAMALIGEDYFNDFAQNDFALSMADQASDLDLLVRMFDVRVEAQPEVAQNYASLAFIYYKQGETKKAIDILKTAGAKVPTFTKTAECFAGNIEKGNAPDEGC